jgi:hypothetical protein
VAEDGLRIAETVNKPFSLLYCAMGMTFWLPQTEAALAQVA